MTIPDGEYSVWSFLREVVLLSLAEYRRDAAAGELLRVLILAEIADQAKTGKIGGGKRWGSTDADGISRRDRPAGV